MRKCQFQGSRCCLFAKAPSLLGQFVWLAISTIRGLERSDSACGNTTFCPTCRSNIHESMSHASCQGNLWRMVAHCRRWICNLETRRSSNVFSIERGQQSISMLLISCKMSRNNDQPMCICAFKCIYESQGFFQMPH